MELTQTHLRTYTPESKTVYTRIKHITHTPVYYTLALYHETYT